MECDVGELLEGFRDKVMQETGIPTDQMRLRFDGDRTMLLFACILELKLIGCWIGWLVIFYV